MGVCVSVCVCVRVCFHARFVTSHGSHHSGFDHVEDQNLASSETFQLSYKDFIDTFFIQQNRFSKVQK